MGGRDFVRAWPESPRAIAHLIPDVVARDLPFLIADASSGRRPHRGPGFHQAHRMHTHNTTLLNGINLCLTRIKQVQWLLQIYYTSNTFNLNGLRS